MPAPDAQPEVFSLDLLPSVEVFASGMQSAISRGFSVKLEEGFDLKAQPPGTVSLKITKPRIATKTYAFVEPQEPVIAPPPKPKPKPKLAEGSAGQPKKATRLKPPGDVVKLVDRLFYVLQPPLETLIGSGSLEMPFQPFPYQLEGIAFLYPSHKAILADEMGLGKTMQSITAMRLLLHAGEVRRVLLICPKPLVNNWTREFALWAPELPVSVIEGDQARRRWQWEMQSPLRIANYELLLRDREVLEDPEMHFDLVVLDESQRIKNSSSTTAQVVRSISRTRSWALTGTPIENSTDDLVGIFEFLSPGYLTTDMRIARMSKLAGDFIMRALKDMVLTDMPPKMFRDAEVELTPAQQESYQMAEKEGVLKLTDMGDEITIQHVFELVLRLKQICNFDPATGESAKLDRLLVDLDEVAKSGKKAIIFSQWVRTLKRIKQHLKPYNALEFHGQIPSKQRPAILDQFKEDPTSSVLLLSYGAGSVGLNLQFASYAFLFDRWWNPAIEDQAINRVHRIGSAGPVTITRFLSMGTIEERINQVLEEKRELSEALFAQADASPRGLNRKEIFGLFDLTCPGGAIDKAA